MIETLLQTKLYAPPLRANLVARPRLVERLDQGLDSGCTLTLVSAPAGFGKTTLLAEWLSHCRRPTAWLGLDESDNDLARFVAYLEGTLQKVEPDIGNSAVEALRSFGGAAADTPPAMQQALTLLLNDISSTASHFILVLDDYHLVDALSIHEAVAFMLDNQPPQMHLVIATRVDPPIHLARLRAQARLNELRVDELAFTNEEIELFLNDVMGFSLTAEQIGALERSTEGWIAGLQLAALSMQGHADVEGFINSFTGSHRFIFDYLTEEVLSRQSREIQDFLTQTAVLERLCAPLCDTVCARDDSQRILEALDAANLFILPLDNERIWYRYHHLFADLMRQRLRRENYHLLPLLHLRAGEWYLANGFAAEAVGHLLAASDYEGAAELIEKTAWEMLTRGEMTTLLGWIDALPNDMVHSRPGLGVLRVWALAISGQWDEAESYSTRLVLAPEEGNMTAVRAYIAGMRGDVPRSIDLAQQALERLPRDNAFLRSQVALSLGSAYANGGESMAAHKALSEAIKYSRAAGRTYLTMLTMAMLGHIEELQGRLHQAARTQREALLLADAHSSRQVPSAGTAHLGLAEVLYEWNDLDGALQHAQAGCELSAMGGSMNSKLGGFVTLAQVYLALGELVHVRGILQEAQALGQGLAYSYAKAMLFDVQTRYWLAEGDLAAAARSKQHLSSDESLYLAYETEQIAAARVLLARKHVAQALRLLAELLEAAEPAKRLRNLLKILALQACAFHIEGDVNGALSMLEQALTLAEPQGFVRTFIDEGQPMACLLRLALSQSSKADYAARLIAAIGQEKELMHSGSGLPIEPLSPRELEVLRLIVAGLSNREIAKELVVAESTVKSHTNHIYSKLAVKNRTQALIRAQESGILESATPKSTL